MISDANASSDMFVIMENQYNLNMELNEIVARVNDNIRCFYVECNYISKRAITSTVV